jgi:DNA polymerase III subunit delta
VIETWSASAPPYRPNTTSGTSSTIPSAPTAKFEPTTAETPAKAQFCRRVGPSMASRRHDAQGRQRLLPTARMSRPAALAPHSRERSVPGNAWRQDGGPAGGRLRRHSVTAGWHAGRVMPLPSAADLLGTTTLVTGGNEFLAERSIAAIRAVVRAADPDADLMDVPAAELGAGAVAEIASPSLFASLRCVVVRGLEDLPDDGAEALLQYVATPAADVVLVLHHSGGTKGKAFLDGLRRAKVTEIMAADPKSWELRKWVVEEFRSHKVRVHEQVASALVDAIGDDLRALAAATDQLVADAAGEPVTEQRVRRYFGGRAEVKGFAVADAAIDGKTGDAIEQLRWALTTGTDAVLITSAVASGLRGVARYQSAAQGLREADLARELGVPPFKVKQLARQSRSWSPRGLAVAIQAAARADADVKGGSGDRLWACERLVISVLRARALS